MWFQLFLFNAHRCFFLVDVIVGNFNPQTLLFQDEEVGFAYISQREARPSLYEYLAKYINFFECTSTLIV